MHLSLIKPPLAPPLIIPRGILLRPEKLPYFLLPAFLAPIASPQPPTLRPSLLLALPMLFVIVVNTPAVASRALRASCTSHGLRGGLHWEDDVDDLAGDCVCCLHSLDLSGEGDNIADSFEVVGAEGGHGEVTGSTKVRTKLISGSRRFCCWCRCTKEHKASSNKRGRKKNEVRHWIPTGVASLPHRGAGYS